MIPIGVPHVEKVTVSSNMPYLMKGWSERSIFIVGRDDLSVSSKKLETGDQPLPKLFLCSSKICR